MAYNPKIHHRRSIRLKGYDYSLADLYYVTIHVWNSSGLHFKLGPYMGCRGVQKKAAPD